MSDKPIISEIPFDPMLAYAVAENRVSVQNKPWDDEELCEQFDLTLETFAQLKLQPSFCKAVVLAVADLKKTGGSVRTKSAMQFEHYLDQWIPQVMNDPEAPLSEKVKLFAMLGKTGGLIIEKPQQVEVANLQQQPSLTLNLMLPNQGTPEKLIN